MNNKRKNLFILWAVASIIFVAMSACRPEDMTFGKGQPRPTLVNEDFARLWNIVDGGYTGRVHRFIDEKHENVCYVVLGYSSVAIDCVPEDTSQ